MKIRDLHIDGFGHFAGREFGPFDQPVTVLYGPNEAGKTTLLEFLRAVLFGFRDGRSRRNLYEPLAGGRHGGSVTIIGEGGESVIVRRVQGSHGGRVTLTTASGEPLPESDRPRLLGNHSRDSFEKIFAFTIDELHDAALLNDQTVNSQIYGAGMGATKLPDALRTLERQKRDLFLVGGSSHHIYKAAGALDQVNSGIGEVENNAKEYAQLTDRLEHIERELDELRNRRNDIASELRAHQNLERAWEDWNVMVSARRRLQRLPQIMTFPANGANRLDLLQERAQSELQEMESAAAAVQNAEQAVAIPIDNESLLKHSSAIRTIERSRTAFDQSLKDLPERKAELATKRTELDTALAELGPDWDAERLASFDLSIVAQEEVSTHADRRRTASEEVVRSQSALVAAETALQEAAQTAERTQGDAESAPQPELDRSGIRERRGSIRQARDALSDIARRTDRIHDLRAQLDDAPPSMVDNARLGAAALAIAGVILVVLSTFFGAEAMIVGIPIGAVLIAAALYLFRRGIGPQSSAASTTSARIRRQIETEEQEVADLQAKLDDEAATIGIDQIDSNGLITAEGDLDEEQARITQRDNLATVLRDAKNLLDQRTRRRNESAAAVERARTELQSANDDWKEWLAARGLRREFSPDRIDLLRALIERGRGSQNGVIEWESRTAAIQKDIDEFIALVHPVAASLNIEFDPAAAATVADDLIDMHALAAEKSRARNNAEKDLDSARADLQDRRQRLDKTEKDISDLLAAAGAQDPEEFRQLAEHHAERQQTEESIENALDRLQRISGPGAALDTLQTELAQSNADTIDDAIRRSEQDLKEIDDPISSLLNEQGAIRNSLDGLLSEEDSSRLRADRHRLLEEMRHHAREWTVLTLAENLLREAQAKFERERQPDVIRHSEKFFRDITGGRYQTVFSPLGASEIHVTDSTDAPKQPAQLSRGAREQLFLSLRFGLIRELGERAERLPVIVDEVLVNFDPQRALRAANAFVELSQSNQVLVFTCHPSVVDRFRTASSQSGAPEPEVVDIR